MNENGIYCVQGNIPEDNKMRIMLKDGEKVTPYPEQQNPNKPQGYALVAQNKEVVQMSFRGPIFKTQSRVALMSGEVRILKKMIEGFENNGHVPGQIVTKDYFESELPEHYREDQEVLDGLVKKAGDSDDAVILQGARKIENLETGQTETVVENIYSIKIYDFDGSMEDSVIPHINSSEIRKQNKRARKIKTLENDELD